MYFGGGTFASSPSRIVTSMGWLPLPRLIPRYTNGPQSPKAKLKVTTHLIVRPNGADHQRGKDPPRQMWLGLVANEH